MSLPFGTTKELRKRKNVEKRCGGRFLREDSEKEESVEETNVYFPSSKKAQKENDRRSVFLLVLSPFVVRLREKASYSNPITICNPRSLYTRTHTSRTRIHVYA